jgi:hypothetical protein
MANSGNVRSYSRLDEMISDGGSVVSPRYLHSISPLSIRGQ